MPHFGFQADREGFFCELLHHQDALSQDENVKSPARAAPEESRAEIPGGAANRVRERRAEKRMILS
jgi:hypothetical protein